MLTKIPIKKVVIIIFHSLLEKLVQDPIIKGRRRSGNFILSTFSPIVVSFEIGSQKSSIKKSPEKIIGKYFWSFIFFHFNWKSSSKIQFRVSPIKERLIGTLPKLMLAAKQEIKKTYTFLCVVFFSNYLMPSIWWYLVVFLKTPIACSIYGSCLTEASILPF